MKKYLVATTALISAVIAMPAQAELNLDLGGHFRGYGVYADDDTANARDFAFVRDTEIHFTGEATSDNGLTVGVHYEAVLGSTNVETDEAYAYFAGNWGRVNLGKEDGAAYLLQVAAPSADSNVDGLRTNIQGVNTLSGVALDYDHADFRGAQRLTYLTPKFSGFQAGVSYAADDSDRATTGGAGALGGIGTDAVGQFENMWEGAARWDGEFEGFGLSAGAGYSTGEVQATNLLVDPRNDKVETWNLGLNVAFQGFSVGAAYIESTVDFGALPAAPTAPGIFGGDSETWVVGAAWDNGPYHVGASYLNSDIDAVTYTTGPASSAAGTVEVDRWAVGAGYTYGPGMSFRGTVAMGDVEIGTTDEDYTQVTVGTDIQF
jgi:hypothetical protein